MKEILWRKFNDEKNLFVLQKFAFYQQPHHQPSSQLIWIETQLTSFRTYNEGIGK